MVGVHSGRLEGLCSESKINEVWTRGENGRGLCFARLGSFVHTEKYDMDKEMDSFMHMWEKVVHT